MSEFVGQDTGFSWISLSNAQASTLMSIMDRDAFVPGKPPSYEACKTIYAYHPLGAALVDRPLKLAMSQPRELSVDAPGEDDLVKAFEKEWKRLGSIGADNIIFRVAQQSRIYGIATLCVNSVDGEKAAPTSEPLAYKDLYKKDLYFNIYDPLNTAGSLVLNQDPAAVDFMHPRQVVVGAQVWNNTKAIVLMHEQPIWIEWTDSAFGFVGRSVFQRPFYMLRSFLYSMMADNMIQAKLAALVYNTESPGSVLDNVAKAFWSQRRTDIKMAQTGNVISIGEKEKLESLNLEHVHSAGEYSRNNIIKNIATCEGMPAQLLLNDTLTQGFGEGAQDAKIIGDYIDDKRSEMEPVYDFIDSIVMRRAWNPEFFRMMQQKMPGRYRKMNYEAAFHLWRDAYTKKWPNFLKETDSDKMKAAESRINAAVGVAKELHVGADPENSARISVWLADTISQERDVFPDPLILDADALANYRPEPMVGSGINEGNDVEASDLRTLQT